MRWCMCRVELCYLRCLEKQVFRQSLPNGRCPWWATQGETPVAGRVGIGREIRSCGTAEPKLSACPVRPCTGCWKLPEGSSRLSRVLFNHAQKINQRHLTASCQTTSEGRQKDGAIPPTTEEQRGCRPVSALQPPRRGRRLSAS